MCKLLIKKLNIYLILKKIKKIYITFTLKYKKMKKKSFNFHKFMVILRKNKDSFKIFLNFLFFLNLKILRQKNVNKFFYEFFICVNFCN